METELVDDAEYVVTEIHPAVPGWDQTAHVWYANGKRLADCMRDYEKQRVHFLTKEESQNECNLELWSNHYGGCAVVHIVRIAD